MDHKHNTINYNNATSNYHHINTYQETITSQRDISFYVETHMVENKNYSSSLSLIHYIDLKAMN